MKTEEDRFANYLSELARLSEMQRTFRRELWLLRNRFFSEFPMVAHIGDAEWVEIFWSIHDMWENSPSQEAQRLAEFEPDLFAGPSEEAEDASMGRLCRVCGFPLTGRQRLYCSGACKKISRRRKGKSGS